MIAPRDEDNEPEIGDEEMIPGPEGNEGFEETSTGGEALRPDTPNSLKPEGRLVESIRRVLTRLQEWSQSVNLVKMENRPMKMGLVSTSPSRY